MKEKYMVVKNQENYDHVTSVNTKIIVCGLLLSIIFSGIVLVFNILKIGMNSNNAIASSVTVFMLSFFFVMIISNVYCAYKLFPDLVDKYKNR